MKLKKITIGLLVAGLSFASVGASANNQTNIEPEFRALGGSNKIAGMYKDHKKNYIDKIVEQYVKDIKVMERKAYNEINNFKKREIQNIKRLEREFLRYNDSNGDNYAQRIHNEIIRSAEKIEANYRAVVMRSLQDKDTHFTNSVRTGLAGAKLSKEDSDDISRIVSNTTKELRGVTVDLNQSGIARAVKDSRNKIRYTTEGYLSKDLEKYKTEELKKMYAQIDNIIIKNVRHSYVNKMSDYNYRPYK